MCEISPEIVLPDIEILLEASTAMYDGTLLAGGGLLPVVVLHVPPQTGGVVLRVLAKPLNAAGAGPPDRAFSLYHCAPHHVTVPPLARAFAAVLSPSVNEPLAREANTSAFWLFVASRS